MCHRQDHVFMGSCFRSYINSIRKNFFFSLNSGTQPTLPNKDGIDPFYQHKMLDDDISISGVRSSASEESITKSYLDELSMCLHKTKTNEKKDDRWFKEISNGVTVTAFSHWPSSWTDVFLDSCCSGTWETVSLRFCWIYLWYSRSCILSLVHTSIDCQWFK